MRDARARPAEPRDFVARRVNAVRVPHVVTDPSEPFGEFDRTATVPFETVPFFIERLGEMRMRVDAVRSRERDTLAHQMLGNGERRTRRDDDTRHRKPARIVMAFDRALRIPQDRAFVFDAIVRRQTALRAPDGHRTARGMKAQTDIARSFDLVVDAAAVGPQIRVVARGRAAGKQQLGAGDRGRATQRRGRQASPDRIERDEPIEQLDVLRSRHGARERLIEMMMRVDEPRHDETTARIDDALGVLAGDARIRPDCFDDAVANVQRAAVESRVTVVEGFDA